jgi:hypothetical protein
VAQLAQSVLERLHGECDAIDVRRVGFSDQFDVQESVHDGQCRAGAFQRRDSGMAPM